MLHVRTSLLIVATTLGCSREPEPTVVSQTRNAPRADAPSAANGVSRSQSQLSRPVGPGAFLLSGARDLEGLPERQRARLAELTARQQATSGLEGTRLAKLELRRALTLAVNVGHADSQILRSRLDALDTALRARAVFDAQTLNALHAALEPDQRRALSEWVRRQRPSRGPASMPSDGALRMQRLLDAFERDTFDASRVDLYPRQALRNAERLVREVTALLPTADARGRAALLRQITPSSGEAL